MKFNSTLLLILLSQFSFGQTNISDTISPIDYSHRKTTGYEVIYDLDYIKKEQTTAIVVNNKLVFDFLFQKEILKEKNQIIKFDILKEFRQYKDKFKLDDKIQTVISYTVSKKLFRDLKKRKK